MLTEPQSGTGQRHGKAHDRQEKPTSPCRLLISASEWVETSPGRLSCVQFCAPVLAEISRLQSVLVLRHIALSSVPAGCRAFHSRQREACPTRSVREAAQRIRRVGGYLTILQFCKACWSFCTPSPVTLLSTRYNHLRPLIPLRCFSPASPTWVRSRYRSRRCVSTLSRSSPASVMLVPVRDSSFSFGIVLSF